MSIFLGFLLIFAMLLQGTLTTVPLAIAVFLCIGILRRDNKIFIIGFFAGLFIDIFSLHQVGTTSLFLVAFAFLIFLYQRKYEINSVPFVIFSTSLGTFFYLWLLKSEYILLNSIAATIFGIILFIILRIFMVREGGRAHDLIAPKEGIHFKR